MDMIDDKFFDAAIAKSKNPQENILKEAT